MMPTWAIEISPESSVSIGNCRLGERLVALENLDYGNALYIFEENWVQLTQLSRTELIRRHDPSLHRLPHLPGCHSQACSRQMTVLRLHFGGSGEDYLSPKPVIHLGQEL